MNNIPDFADAVRQFRQFLIDDGHSANVFWIFRDDVWKLSPTDVRVRYPSPAKNIALAQKVFAEGRERGLVEIQALATAGEEVAATVWFPKYPEEEVQGWNQGMKLSIAKPLPHAKKIQALRWSLLRLLPRFRRYQKVEFGIGTKSWAAAA
ncbi:MAG: hypothetical protein ABI882_11220 [Acidobacteriota bacterium]